MSRATRDRRNWRCHQSSIRSSPAASVAPKDSTPYFITANGPTREARFPFFFNPNGTVNTNAPNGGVEDLFTVTGRSDAGSLQSAAAQLQCCQQANNIIFRIPTPTFGAGLIENLDDSTSAEQPGDQSQQQFWHRRHLQPQRQRWHHQPFRLEGAEQVAAHLYR